MRALLLLPFLGACVPTLADGFADDLQSPSGCADLILYATNADDTVMLRFQDDAGAVTQAVNEGAALTFEYDLPANDIRLEVMQGKKVSSAMCTDVIENGGPDLSRTWSASTGHAHLVVTPGTDPTGYDSTADLSLTDVTFTAASGGDQASLPDFDFTGITVGWLAG
jgi:hypothetical protein